MNTAVKTVNFNCDLKRLDSNQQNSYESKIQNMSSYVVQNIKIKFCRVIVHGLLCNRKIKFYCKMKITTDTTAAKCKHNNFLHTNIFKVSKWNSGFLKINQHFKSKIKLEMKNFQRINLKNDIVLTTQ